MKSLEEAVYHRRSVRNYKKNALDTEKVKECLELAALAPNSSNMQLWEFYHITDKKLLEQLGKACFGQSAATSAEQMVAFVTRQDLHLKRARAILDLEIKNIHDTSPPDRIERRIKRVKNYYGGFIPFLYANFFGLVGFVRKIVVTIVGLFRPVYREVGEGDMNAVVHKSAALAAQTFMLAMAAVDYDTCPMEGYDSKKVRRLLKLPRGAKLNMIVSCGVRDKGGVWGERRRVPFEEVYKRV